MNFIEAVKEAEKNGWVAISRESLILIGAFFIPTDNAGHIWMHTPIDGPDKLIPLWQPSQDDLLADDWYPVGLSRKRFYQMLDSGAIKPQEINVQW